MPVIRATMPVTGNTANTRPLPRAQTLTPPESSSNKVASQNRIKRPIDSVQQCKNCQKDFKVVRTWQLFCKQKCSDTWHNTQRTLRESAYIEHLKSLRRIP